MFKFFSFIKVKTVVSESPYDFSVGINAACFFKMIKHFESENTLKKIMRSETVEFLSNTAINIYSSVLESNQTIERKGCNIRITTAKDSEGADEKNIMLKTKLSLPDSKTSVFPEGFKMCLSKEDFFDDDEMMSIMQTLHELPTGIFTKRQKVATEV